MPTKYASPLLGYNNNVRHKGKVFHIQTEDSGAKYGHIITHLFMDGGRILKSVKTSYAEYIGNDRMADIVREMMKQQHKAMFIALRDGKFDGLVEGGVDRGTDSLKLSRPPSPPSPGSQAHPSIPSADPVPRVEASAAAAISFAEQHEEAPATISEAPELMLDIQALERAATAAASASSPLLRGASDLPPPPANLFRERKATGKYRVAPSPTPPPATEAPRAGPVAARPASSQMASTAGGARRSSVKGMAAAGDRRYAPTRPASIFGQARPQQGKSIFGEDLISDKSLDEVILSYLAEDLDEKK
jgi:hypothetical protein